MQRPGAPDAAFYLLLLVTATLFLRPAELFAPLAGLPIYEVLILSAVALSFRQIQQQFTWQALRRQPVTLCVVGMLAAVTLSHLSHFYVGGMISGGVMFLKTMVYYGLLIAVVTTPKRVRQFALTVTFCATLMVGLCVIDFMGWYDFQFIKTLADRDGVNDLGLEARIMRMRGTGIFADPNDIAMVIVAAGVLSSFFLMESTKGALRFAWLGPMLLLGIALLCTRSRGGLLAAGAAGSTLIVARYGYKVGIVLVTLGLCGVPFLAGRQAEIDFEEGTGHERIELWREGFESLKSGDVLFGIGEGSYPDMAGLVAHNSFIHAYVELGLFGGTLFFGCFFFAILGLYRMGRSNVRIQQPELRRMRPYIAAVIAGWCTSMMSLSRCYVVPTYLIVGFAAAFLNLSVCYAIPRRPLVVWNRRQIGRLIAGSATAFVALYGIVLAFAG